MMRSTAKLWLCIAITALALGVAACGGSDTSACTHQWEWTLDAVEATCVEPSKDTAVCKNTPCDATDIREGATPATGCTYGEWQINAIAPTETDDNKDAILCSICEGIKETRPTLGVIEYATGTARLTFVLINNNTEYHIRRIGVLSSVGGVVHIPRFHRPNASSPYLPVTEVGSTGYSSMNSYITEVNFLAPSNITTIGARAFYYCTRLTSVTIPDSVTAIQNSAFRDCTGLTNVAIGSGVTNIGLQVFENCTSLTSITVDAANPNFASQDGVLYNKVMTRLIRVPGGITGNFIVPNSVTAIGNRAFSGCTGLRSTTIPSSVTTIGNNAFSGCTGLTSVIIPNSVTSIGAYAFERCTGLTSVVIGNGVTSIGNSVFLDCTELTSVTVLAATPPTLGGWVFDSAHANLQIFVPAGSVDAYKAARSWSTWASRIVAITP